MPGASLGDGACYRTRWSWGERLQRFDLAGLPAAPSLDAAPNADADASAPLLV